jgi:hypothetical protein
MHRNYFKECGISSRVAGVPKLETRREPSPVVALARPNVALQIIREIRHWTHQLLISDHLPLLRPLPPGGAMRASSGGAQS